MGVYMYGLGGKMAASKRIVEGFPKPKGATVADFQFLGKLDFSLLNSNEYKLKDAGKKSFMRSWGEHSIPDYAVVGILLCRVEKEAWKTVVSRGEDFVNYDLCLSKDMFAPGGVFRIIGIVDYNLATNNYKLVYSGYLESEQEAYEVYNEIRGMNYFKLESFGG